MSESLTFSDKLGKSLKVGDTVIYACSLGRSPGLRWGRVLEIVPNNDYGPPHPTKLKVIGIEEWSHLPPRLQSRVGYLQFPSRVLLQDPKDVPKEISELLDSFVG